MQQIIKEPTNLTNTSSSCIDLIFTSKPNLITDPGEHSSLSPNCRYEIVFAKLNLHIVCPPPYCNFKKSGTSEKQTQGLLQVPSKNLNGKEHFRT